MLGSPRHRELSPVLRPRCSLPGITHDLDSLFFISDELLTVDELSNPVACLFLNSHNNVRKSPSGTANPDHKIIKF